MRSTSPIRGARPSCTVCRDVRVRELASELNARLQRLGLALRRGRRARGTPAVPPRHPLLDRYYGRSRELEGRTCNRWPTPVLDEIEEPAVELAERYSAWGHRKIWELLRRDGACVAHRAESFVLKPLQVPAEHPDTGGERRSHGVPEERPAISRLLHGRTTVAEHDVERGVALGSEPIAVRDARNRAVQPFLALRLVQDEHAVRLTATTDWKGSLADSAPETGITLPQRAPVSVSPGACCPVTLSLVGRMSAFGDNSGRTPPQKSQKVPICSENLAPPAGIEPATPGLGNLPKA